MKKLQGDILRQITGPRCGRPGHSNHLHFNISCALSVLVNYYISFITLTNQPITQFSLGLSENRCWLVLKVKSDLKG